MKFEKPSWKEIEKMCSALWRKVKRSNFAPDLIVGVCRGGWIPARILSNISGNKNLASMRVEFYKGIAKTGKKPVVTQPVSVSVKGKRVLLVDDVSDSGLSLMEARKHLAGAKEVRIATLHYKPRSTLKPDFFIRKTSAWIVYPWETHETAKKQKEKPHARVREMHETAKKQKGKTTSSRA